MGRGEGHSRKKCNAPDTSIVAALCRSTLNGHRHNRGHPAAAELDCVDRGVVLGGVPRGPGELPVDLASADSAAREPHGGGERRRPPDGEKKDGVKAASRVYFVIMTYGFLVFVDMVMPPWFNSGAGDLHSVAS